MPALFEVQRRVKLWLHGTQSQTPLMFLIKSAREQQDPLLLIRYLQAMVEKLSIRQNQVELDLFGFRIQSGRLMRLKLL